MQDPPAFAVSNLTRDTYDIYTHLYYLHTRSDHDGVRDFLIHHLYNRDDDEIELVLPQLCHLYQVWKDPGPLGDFFMHLCSHSIHFTVKILWTLRAQQAHCLVAAQRESIDRLIGSCEMSLVNQSVFGPDGRMRKRERRRKNNKIEGVAKSTSTTDVTTSATAATAASAVTRSHAHTDQSPRDISPISRASSISPASSLSSASSVFRPSADTPPMPSSFELTSIHTGTDAAAAPIDADEPAATPATSSTTTTTSNPRTSGPLSATAAAAALGPVVSRRASVSLACSADHALSIDDLFLLASSNVRAEYFHAMLRLLTDFGRISSAVVKQPQAARSKRLRGYLRGLDPHSRGLYFPMFDRHHRHYRILRLLPEETFVLNSRDKAPFLFHYEVQYTQSSVYDSDIYLAFKSKEQIIKEAIMMHQCANCRKINSEQLRAAEAAKASEDALARERTEPMPDPNPAATIQAAQSQAVSSSGNGSPVAVDTLDDGALPSPISSPLSSPVNGSPPSSARIDGAITRTTSLPGGMDALKLDSTSSKSELATSSAVNDAIAPPANAHQRTASVVDGSSSTALTPRLSPRLTASGPKRNLMLITSTGACPVSPTSSVPRPVALHSAFDMLSVQAFGESFASRRARIQQTSNYHATMPNTDVMSLIYKHGDDCRQEVMAMQLIRFFHRVFAEASLPLRLHPYCVLLTSANSGLIETVKDAISIDSLKKNVCSSASCSSLASFFHYFFAMQGPEAHERALKAFVESMAAYSVLSFLLQIKDRHNGNLMLTASGHVVHIDFGFILANSPGRNANFEDAPFKLTAEFVEVMGGEDSEHFDYFKLLVIRGYLEARKHAHTCLLLFEILSVQSRMACWANNPEAALQSLRERFKLDATEEECVEYAYAIIEQSTNNWRTVQYDKYQRICNYIY